MTRIVLFAEVQRFRQWWMLALLGLIAAGAVWAFVQQVLLGEPWGNNPAPDALLIVLVLLFGLGLPALMLAVHLRTEVRPDGIYVRFWPFHLAWVRIPVEAIQEHEARTYSPLRDYGGWGIRWGRNGKAYNVSGNRGVALTYDGGRHLLIGSRRADELERAISGIRRR